MEHTLPPLPYALDALAPALDWAGRWADALDAGSR